MIDVLPTSHSAIFARPPKKMSPSLVLAILIAIGLHVLTAFYLLTQNFMRPMPPEAPVGETTVVVTMDKPVLKPVDTQKPPPPPSHTIQVHTPAMTTITPVIETPLIPVKGPAGIDTGPVVLPDGGVDGGTSAGPGTGTAGPTYINPRWTAFPDGNTLADYYPERALEDGRTGTAVVECSVLDDAGHVGCSVVSETPKTYGFGAATVKMVEAKGRVDTAQGAVKPGSKLLVTLKWMLSDG